MPSDGTARRALFVELFTSHDDLFPSVLALLAKAGFTVSVAVHEKHRHSLPSDLLEETLFLPNHSGKVQWRALFALARRLRTDPYDLVFFGTFRARQIPLLVMALPARTQVVAIHHNPDRLWTSLSQRLLTRRVRKFLVLSRRARLLIAPRVPRLQVAEFYPTLRPPPIAQPPPEPTLRIAVPGVPDCRKRDYLGLLDAIARTPESFAGVSFHIVGDLCRNDGPRILEHIHANNLSRFFSWYEGYVPDPEFHRAMQSAHLVMPLIHPNCEAADRFRTWKTSGAFIHAFRNHTPLLLEESFRGTDGEYDGFSVFYTLPDLARTIQTLVHNREPLHASRQAMATCARFNFDAQAARLASWLRT